MSASSAVRAGEKGSPREASDPVQDALKAFEESGLDSRVHCLSSNGDVNVMATAVAFFCRRLRIEILNPHVASGVYHGQSQ